MVDLNQSWARFRDLPNDILETLPRHVQTAFHGARRHRFEIELVCAGVEIPKRLRGPRRLVLIADNFEEADPVGPVGFDLANLVADFRTARRIFIVTTLTEAEAFQRAYEGAVEDLGAGTNVAVIIETKPDMQAYWIRAVHAIRGASVAIEEAGAC